jgi:hypothetical protein
MHVVKRSDLEKKGIEPLDKQGWLWAVYVGRALSGDGRETEGGLDFPLGSGDKILEVLVNIRNWWKTGKVEFLICTTGGKHSYSEVPIGVVNNKDTNYLMKILFGSDHAGAAVRALNSPIRRLHAV